MIAGGNWWRANEIVIRHLTRQTATRYRCRDRAVQSDRPGSIVLAFDRLPKKRLGGRDIALGAQPEVNRPPRPIHGTIEIAPFSSNFDVCLVPPPRPAVPLGEPLPALLEPRCVSPHPTHNGRMGQRQAAFGHHLHQVSQAQLEAKIPAHAQDDDLAVEVATLEQLLAAHQLAHAHPSGSSADIIAGQILPFAPEPAPPEPAETHLRTRSNFGSL